MINLSNKGGEELQQRHFVIINEVVTVSEAAKIYGCSNRFIRAECERGKLVCRRTSDGVWLILKSSIPSKEEAK